MNATSPDSLDVNSTQDDAFRNFIAVFRTCARESEAAVDAAKPALARLASAIVDRDNGQALRVRSILLSLCSGGSALADVADILALDWPVRRDLCAVLLAFGHGNFDHGYLKSALEMAGDHGASWFLGQAPDPRERLEEVLSFAKAGPLNAPRSLSERGVAMILLSLFAGTPCDLQFALRGLDRIRSDRVLLILNDYLAQRFDFTDEERVKNCFDLPS